jgi:Response regulator containing a CheY-like receiver domain and an HTH DNA-binding domain
MAMRAELVWNHWMPKPRILLADDHTLVAEAFCRLLEPQFDVVGTASDGRALLEKAVQLKPDVILLDLSMPVLNGFEAGERLKKLLPNARLIVLTMNEDSDVAAEVLRRWAAGFLLKKSASGELVKAIESVMKGKTFVTSQMTQNLLDKFVRDPGPNREKTLTPRQREVLQLLAEGRTMKEAADILQVTPRTVAFHKYKIMEEFELKTNSDLLRFAIKERIIS